LLTQKSPINLYNGVALSNYFSGTEAVYDGGVWNVTGLTNVIGDNSIPADSIGGRDRFFAVTDYYPVSADNEPLKGSWKCRLSKNIGNVKFNKIGLYAVQIDGNGDEVGSPILFAESALSSPITKTNFGADGFDDIVLDVQIQMASVQADFNDVFYSTSGDYWGRTVGGLTYPEKIGVGIFNDGLEEPKAMIDSKSTTEPQQALTYDNNNYVTNRVKVDAFSDDKFLEIIAVTEADEFLYGYSSNISLTGMGRISPKAFGNKSGSSSISIESDLIPHKDNVIILGKINYDYKNIYTKSLKSSTNTIAVDSNLIPISTDTKNLGSSSKRWNVLYAKNMIANSTVSTNVDSTYLTASQWLKIKGNYVGRFIDMPSDQFAIYIDDGTTYKIIYDNEEWFNTHEDGSIKMLASVTSETTTISYHISAKTEVQGRLILLCYSDIDRFYPNIDNDREFIGNTYRSRKTSGGYYHSYVDKGTFPDGSNGIVLLDEFESGSNYNEIAKGSITYRNSL